MGVIRRELYQALFETRPGPIACLSPGNIMMACEPVVERRDRKLEFQESYKLYWGWPLNPETPSHQFIYNTCFVARTNAAAMASHAHLDEI